MIQASKKTDVVLLKAKTEAAKTGTHAMNSFEEMERLFEDSFPGTWLRPRHLLAKVWLMSLLIFGIGIPSALAFTYTYEGRITFTSATNNLANITIDPSVDPSVTQYGDYFVGQFTYNDDDFDLYEPISDTWVRYANENSIIAFGQSFQEAEDGLHSLFGGPIFYADRVVVSGGAYDYEVNKVVIKDNNTVTPVTPVISDSFGVYANGECTGGCDANRVLFGIDLINYAEVPGPFSEADAFDLVELGGKIDVDRRGGDPIKLENFMGEFDQRRLIVQYLPGESNTVIHGELLNLYSSDDEEFAVPEPTTLVLMALGLAGIGFGRRRKAA